MSAPQRKLQYSVERYLALERAAEERHEYLDGQIFAMAGESPEHGDISTNLIVVVGLQLKGTRCRAQTKDTKVLSGPPLRTENVSRVLFSYPDIVVICGEPEYYDDRRDVVLNPKVIFEVLSKSTEAFDRGEKFTRLQTWNATLTDYVLVSQDKPQVEHYSRQSDGSWSYRLYTGLEAVVAIPSISCSLKLAEVYDRVTFPEIASQREGST